MIKYITYIINLEHSVERKNYIQKLLAKYSFLKLQFISAIDGRKLSENELQSEFDNKKCIKRYGRILNGGEIGCILSHRKCYSQLISSSHSYALVLEDDIYPMRDLFELQTIDIESNLNTNIPTILFLSGDYWYWKKTRPIVSVYNAIGSYAYFINRTAAERILSIFKPYNVADDWELYKILGIRLKAVIPYMIDANVNMEILGSEVVQSDWGINRRLMSHYEVWLSYKSAILKRLLKMIGNFESKIRVINNKVVE